MNSGTLYRRAAFTDNPKGGNPAGVWVGETLPPVDVMQRIAAQVGYSETAFVKTGELKLDDFDPKLMTSRLRFWRGKGIHHLRLY